MIAGIFWQPQKGLAASQSFSIDSFVGTYYLDRDKQGGSILTVEEAFVAVFPSSNPSFSGLSRSIPARYQDRDTELKITSVSDSSGKTIPYSTRKDSDHNLVITIGDSSITVYGYQTYNLKYQARGTVDFLNDHDEFYNASILSSG